MRCPIRIDRLIPIIDQVKLNAKYISDVMAVVSVRSTGLSRAVSEQFPSSFKAVSEPFQSSFRAVSE